MRHAAKRFAGEVTLLLQDCDQTLLCPEGEGGS